MLTVYLDGTWRIWPAAEPGCTQEGDEYCITSIPVTALQAAIEAAK